MPPAAGQTKGSSMGSNTDPAALKDAGNAAFKEDKLEDAMEHYTKAIEVTKQEDVRER